ncbi:MAG: SDR family oxidoreductase [Rhizobiaceae bacterium]|nr:SDR family oxidoreductase [Rhizobiaceae bacterium]
MATTLCFQRERETGVPRNINGRDVIHLDGYFERHGNSNFRLCDNHLQRCCISANQFQCLLDDDVAAYNQPQTVGRSFGVVRSGVHYPELGGASVLITGGGSGIGAALTEGFVRQGSKVAFLDIADEPSIALCDSLETSTGNRPLFIKTDVRDIPALEASIATAAKAHGPITVLVNNAATDERHALEDMTVEYWENNQAINLRPHAFSAKAVAPGMKAAGGGSIINFTSTSFLINHPEMPSYTAAKAGIVGLTKGLAGLLGKDRIRVNAIAPGWVITERQRQLWVTEEALAAHVARQCIKDIMLPHDMVGPVLFLASNGSRMITAQMLIVDGGSL